MEEHNKETIVVSLGGSIVVPDGPDAEFINAFRDMILEEVAKGKKFVIIVGGGKTCRLYQESLRKVMDAGLEDLDWMGIYVTRLNAELIRMSFGTHSSLEIVDDPSMLSSVKNSSVIVGAGWKPGWSTDYIAVIMAEKLGAKKIINVSNIDYAYDKDPQAYPEAKKLESVSWPEYRTFIPREWTSGLSTPFDPIASSKAETLGMEVAIMNGRNIDNMKKYLSGEKFIGTIIK